MIAYRLGDLPDSDHPKELEKLPAGPRLSPREAEQVRLPDGTLYRDATVEQVVAWFDHLFEQAGASERLLLGMLKGLDLAEWDDRWYALNEILELGSVRDAFEGKVRQVRVVCRQEGGLSKQELEALLEEYGLRIAISRKATGVREVYAQRYTPPRAKIYLGTLAALENGELLREQVVEKLERKMADCKQEAA